MNAVTVADFDLLCDTWQDIQMLEWAQPANHKGMVMYFGIKHAKEEICCLNVKIHCLLTFLYDDYVNHYCAVTQCLKVRSQDWKKTATGPDQDWKRPDQQSGLFIFENLRPQKDRFSWTSFIG